MAAAIADFVNQRLAAKVMNNGLWASVFSLPLLCRLFLDASLHVALLFSLVHIFLGFSNALAPRSTVGF